MSLCMFSYSNVKANHMKLALLHGHNTSGHPTSGLEFLNEARHSKVIQKCLEMDVYDLQPIMNSVQLHRREFL